MFLIEVGFNLFFSLEGFIAIWCFRGEFFGLANYKCSAWLVPDKIESQDIKLVFIVFDRCKISQLVVLRSIQWSSILSQVLFIDKLSLCLLFYFIFEQPKIKFFFFPTSRVMYCNFHLK